MAADAYVWKPWKGQYVLFGASDFFFYFERCPQMYFFLLLVIFPYIMSKQ